MPYFHVRDFKEAEPSHKHVKRLAQSGQLDECLVLRFEVVFSQLTCAGTAFDAAHLPLPAQAATGPADVVKSTMQLHNPGQDMTECPHQLHQPVSNARTSERDSTDGPPTQEGSVHAELVAVHRTVSNTMAPDAEEDLSKDASASDRGIEPGNVQSRVHGEWGAPSTGHSSFGTAQGTVSCPGNASAACVPSVDVHLPTIPSCVSSSLPSDVCSSIPCSRCTVPVSPQFCLQKRSNDDASWISSFEFSATRLCGGELAGRDRARVRLRQQGRSSLAKLCIKLLLRIASINIASSSQYPWSQNLWHKPRKWSWWLGCEHNNSS